MQGSLQATTLKRQKVPRKKKWLLSTISSLETRPFHYIFFTPFLSVKGFCNRRWCRRSRRNFKEDILAGDNLILLSSYLQKKGTHFRINFLLVSNSAAVWMKKWNWTENRWTVLITRTSLVYLSRILWLVQCIMDASYLFKKVKKLIVDL